MDIFKNFYNAVSSVLNEQSTEENTILKFQAAFVLQEAVQPWKKREDWLTKNPKVDKNRTLKAFKKDNKDVVFETFLINLLPSKQSGLNLCMCASKACAATCLHTSGNIGALVGKTVGRLRKSWFFVMEREKALEQIVDQIAAKKSQIDQQNKKSPDKFIQLVIRLNGTQDIIWRNIRNSQGENIFDIFPDVIFYDYTKIPSEMEAFANGEMPPNYHLTLSYGGNFTSNMAKTLGGGKNLAVAFGPGKLSSLDKLVFPSSIKDLFANMKYPENINTFEKQEKYRNKIKNDLIENNAYPTDSELAKFAGETLFPGLFHCYEVIDGDRHDARFLDDHLHAAKDESEISTGYSPNSKKKHGLIVGLVAKGALTYDHYDSAGTGWAKDVSGFMVGPNDPGLDTSACEQIYVSNVAKKSRLIEKTNLYKKVAKAMYIIRNYDARHVESNKKFIDTRKSTPRLTDRAIKPISGRPKDTEKVSTFLKTKERVPTELDTLNQAIQNVFQGKSIGKMAPRNKSIVSTVKSLQDYLLDPQVREKLRDPKFIADAKAAGIDINFASLNRLLDSPTAAYVDPAGQKTRVPLTVLPPELVSKLAKNEGFTFVDFVALQHLQEVVRSV